MPKSKSMAWNEVYNSPQRSKERKVFWELGTNGKGTDIFLPLIQNQTTNPIKKCLSPPLNITYVTKPILSVLHALCGEKNHNQTEAVILDTGMYQVQIIGMKQRMHMGMTLGAALDLSRDKYWELIHEIEDSELFHKLSHGADFRAVEIVPLRRYVPYIPPGEDNRDFEAQEFIPAPESGESIPESEIGNLEPALMKRIRDMGKDRFYYYFIEGEGTDGEVAALLETTIPEIKRIRSIFDRALITDTLGTEKSTQSMDTSAVYSQVTAELYPLGGRIQIQHNQERVRYRVDQERLEKMMHSGKLNAIEISKFNRLREKMNLINSRLDLLHRIVEAAVLTQEKYLLTGLPEKMKILEESDLAAILGVDVSWVSRLVNGKAIKRYLKMGRRFFSLRELFISRRELNKRLGKRHIREIIGKLRQETGGKHKKKIITDEDLREILKNKYGIHASRKTINNWRREIK